MWEHAISDGHSNVGTLQIERDGLYYIFTAWVSPTGFLRRLCVTDSAGHTLTLGTPIPSGNRFRLTRRISVTQLLWDGFDPGSIQSAELIPSDAAAPSAPASTPDFTGAPPILPSDDPLLARCPTSNLLFRQYGNTCEAAEPLDPRRPLTLAAWFTRLEPRTLDGRQFLILKWQI